LLERRHRFCCSLALDVRWASLKKSTHPRMKSSQERQSEEIVANWDFVESQSGERGIDLTNAPFNLVPLSLLFDHVAIASIVVRVVSDWKAFLSWLVIAWA